MRQKAINHTRVRRGFVWALVIVILVVGLAAIILWQMRKVEKIYLLTGAYQAYYELTTTSSRESVASGDEVNLGVNLITSGEPFDAASAVVEWDETAFEFVSAQKRDLSGQFTSTVSGVATGSATLSYAGTASDSAMTTNAGVATGFATVVLRALRNINIANPTSVMLATGIGELSLNFVDSPGNAVDQTLVDNETMITFGVTATPSPSPSVTPSPSPTPTPTPTPTPSPSPSPSPGSISCALSTIQLQNGWVPVTVTLHGGANLSSGTIVGYQWDFENNGLWDTGVLANPVTHTYTQPGVYQPVYRVKASTGSWSETCVYLFKVIAYYRADLNKDKIVDVSDYSLLVGQFLQTGVNLLADINGDSIVDISDYSLLLNNYLSSIP